MKFVATSLLIVLLIALGGCKDEAKIEASKAEFDKEPREFLSRTTASSPIHSILPSHRQGGGSTGRVSPIS